MRKVKQFEDTEQWFLNSELQEDERKANFLKLRTDVLPFLENLHLLETCYKSIHVPLFVEKSQKERRRVDGKS